MLLVDDLAAGGTKNLRHTPRGLVTLSSEAFSNQKIKNWVFDDWVFLWIRLTHGNQLLPKIT